MYKGIEKIDANQKGKKMKRKIQVGSVGFQLFSKQSTYPKLIALLCQTLEHINVQLKLDFGEAAARLYITNTG